MIILDKIYPIQPLDESIYHVTYMINGDTQSMMGDVYYANQLLVSSKKTDEVNIICGHGYVAEKADEWSNKFITDGIWQGGDGIFSFNLEDGKDHFDQEKQKKTLLVFGDSFIGRFDPKTEKRLEPYLMPNNTLAYIDGETIDFKVNRGDLEDVTGYYELPKRYDVKGHIARNLVTYEPQKPLEGFISGYDATNT